jgi:hypothetical protein
MSLDLDAIFDPDRRSRPSTESLLTQAEGCPACGRSHSICSPSELPTEWYLEWDERAAIMEYDGNMSRERAEHEALLDILKQLKARTGNQDRQTSLRD